MLSEIYCESFYQKKVIFNDSLSVVLGTQTGDNSIGKSTFLLIVDFVFGGNQYAQSRDILEHVEAHEICFKFIFNGQAFFFSRLNTQKNELWQCDEKYKHLRTMELAVYREWLAEKYNITGASFRDAASRYIRVYGKENCNEKMPLCITPKESKKTAIVSLLKLLGRYEGIAKLETQAQEAKKALSAFNNAQEHGFLTKMNKKQYEANLREMQRLNRELMAVENVVNDGLIVGCDVANSEMALEIKQQLTRARRLRGRYKSRLDTLGENANYPFSDTTKTFEELQKFFPNVNVKHLQDIEQFHVRIASIFNQELEEEKEQLKRYYDEESQNVQFLEEELRRIIGTPDLSSTVLKKYADIKRLVEKAQQENKAYEQHCNLKLNKSESSQALKTAKSEIYGDVENMINKEMERINGLLYAEKYNPPILHLTDSSYTFHTPEDTGTGIAYKGLVVYDLAIAHLTKIPILVHDSVLLKQISDEAIENLLKQYTQCSKQVVIALDKQGSYSLEAAKILEENCILRLASGGQELFGRAWGKQSFR